MTMLIARLEIGLSEHVAIIVSGWYCKERSVYPRRCLRITVKLFFTDSVQNQQ
jgi:hypothetical protein